jgi:hypothetical protein
MSYSYLNNKKWKELTREERYFCAELFFYYKDKQKEFIQLLCDCETIKEAIDSSDLSKEWELGYEVCFYRDLLYHLKKEGKISSMDLQYSPKRTFDLCLFSEDKIIIIEAKVQQPFQSDQLEDFGKDAESIKSLLKEANYNCPLSIHFIGLASSVYFDNVKKFGKKGVPHLFIDNHLSWKFLHEKTGQEVFSIADRGYKN